MDRAESEELDSATQLILSPAFQLKLFAGVVNIIVTSVLFLRTNSVIYLGVGVFIAAIHFCYIFWMLSRAARSNNPGETASKAQGSREELDRFKERGVKDALETTLDMKTRLP